MALEFSRTELAAYASHMPPKWYLVARLRWCLDYSAKPYLMRHLMRAVEILAKREHWPEEPGIRCHHCQGAMTGRQYRRTLCELAVDAMAHPERYPTIRELAWNLGVSERSWHAKHREPYGAVWQMLENWLSAAWGVLSKAQAE